MNFLVLGCNGMAGHVISLYLKENGHNVLGFAREKSKFIDSIVGDACDTEKLAHIISNGKFDSVINCVGLLNQFAEQNQSDAVFLNAYLPHFLAKITKETNTQIIHMSTDCVFSGKRGGYTEADLPDGESFYDRSKALGELDDDKNVTLRTSIVGPDIKESGIGLLNWFMKNTTQVISCSDKTTSTPEKKLKGYTKAIWTGQTTLQLAKTMEAAANQKAHGIINIVPDTYISKYDLLQLFNKYLRQGMVDIEPIEGINLDKSLKRTNYDFDYNVPGYESMIKDLAGWIHEHKELYPHYSVQEG